MSDPALSQAAADKIVELAQEAAKQDGWMQPVDEVFYCEDRTDYGQFQDGHRSSWEDTCQFQLRWGERIHAILEDDAASQGVNKLLQGELYFYEFWLEGVKVFWDEWEEQQKLYEFWQTHVANAAP